MGTVYRAFDPVLERNVAIKLLEPRQRGDETSRLRLLREARTASSVRHPHVVTIHDAGEHEGVVFIAMELIDGVGLDQYCAQQRQLDTRTQLDLMIAAAEGMHAIHQAGLVHRDVKPSNMMVDRDGRVVVTDFGLATATSGVSEARGWSATQNRALDARLTLTGERVGTPLYMAPETMKGAPGTARSDQYAFCAAWFEALVGIPAFRANSYDELLAAKQRGPERVVKALPALWAVLARGLAPCADERFPDMRQLVDALRRIRYGRRRKGLLAVGIAGSVALGGFLLVERDGTCETSANLWNERRPRLEASFHAFGSDRAEHSWSVVRDAVDDLLGRQVVEERRACQRLNARGPSAAIAATMLCLENNRAAVRSLLLALEQVDETVVEGGPALVESIPDPAQCRDVDAAAFAEQQRDLPGVRKLRDKLFYIRLDLELGRFEGVEARLHAVRDQVTALSSPALLADVLLTEGELLQRTGRAKAARDQLEAAINQSIIGKAPRTRVLALNALVYVVGAQLEDGAAARRLSQQAEAELEAMGGDDRLEVGRLMSFVAAAENEGAFEEALAVAEQAVRRIDATQQPLLAANAVCNVGSLKFRLDDFDGALDSWEQCMQMWRARVGDAHPEIAAVEVNVALLHWVQADLAAAAVAIEHALEILERSRLRQELITALTIGAGIDIDAGRIERGLARGRQAVSAVGRLHGESSLAAIETRTSYVRALLNAGRVQQASAELERALEIREGFRGEPPTPLAIELADLDAKISYESGDLARAQAVLEELLPMETALVGDGHHNVGATLAFLGEVLLERGQTAQAQSVLAKANAIAVGPAHASYRAMARFAWARAIVATSVDRGDQAERCDRALGLAREAHAQWWSEDSEGAAEVLAWIERHQHSCDGSPGASSGLAR